MTRDSYRPFETLFPSAARALFPNLESCSYEPPPAPLIPFWLTNIHAVQVVDLGER